MVNGQHKIAPPSDTPIMEDTWYHVAATYDGSSIKIYVNGVEEGTPTIESGPIDYIGEQQDFKIGAGEKGNGLLQNHFDGSIDDVRVYDRALSAEEVWQLYQAGL